MEDKELTMNAPRIRLDFTDIKVAPFTIKMADQWKPVSLGSIEIMKIDVERTRMMTSSNKLKS